MSSAGPAHPDRRSPDLTGSHTVRVRYSECDPMGVAHHGSCVPWLEEARTELLRSAGVSYAQLEREGVMLAITRLEARYRRPARYDDLLEVRVRVTGGTRVKIEHEYEVRLIGREGLGPDALEALRRLGEDLLIAASTTLACVDPEGRPRALPDWLARGGLPRG